MILNALKFCAFKTLQFPLCLHKIWGVSKDKINASVREVFQLF
ncbi:hypothetical protein HPOKI112_00490 [Helicobacter pylori oki112]|nr:hypothetical protein HPOKI102_00495 [Helicobacter pylori oki102]AHN36964.1 hypothetical protein HPOKI112_00490 [Helicobacter pylori oki112]AHN41265.1 hypothetical protein HPOKI422_00500 [Helicobacter pylori oki422]AHN45640.1 hypothetical protein HPOKI898_00505 [Helicobacter pylori oki898]